MKKFFFSTSIVLITALYLMLPRMAAAANTSLVIGGVNIGGSEWGKIGSLTSTTTIGSFSMGGGTISGPGIVPPAALVTVDIMLIPAGSNIKTYVGPHCHIRGRTSGTLPAISGRCNPALAKGSYDVYMIGKTSSTSDATQAGTTYNVVATTSFACSAPPTPPGSNDEGTGDSDFRNPATTLAVLGGNGFLNHGDSVIVETQVAHCDVLVVNHLGLIANQTGPDSFSFLPDPANSSVETVNFKKKARVSNVPCSAVSLPVGHGVNDLINGRLTLGVTADCTLGGSVDRPEEIAVQKSIAAWINKTPGQALPDISVGTTINGGYDTCKNK